MKPAINPIQNALSTLNIILIYIISSSGFGSWSTSFGPFFFGALILSSLVSCIFFAGSIVNLIFDVKIATYLLILISLLIISRKIIWNSDEMVLWKFISMILLVFIINVTTLISSSNAISRINIFLFVNIVLMSALNIFEFFLAPGILSASPGRAAGFWVNPNLTGEAILLSWILIKAGSTHRTFRESLGGVFVDFTAAMGIFTTFSRSAIIIYCIIYAAISLWGFILNKEYKLLAYIKISIIIIISILLSNIEKLNLDLSAYMRISSIINGDYTDDSAIARKNALFDHVDRFMAHPWTGAGPFQSIDITQGLGPHNAYVGMAADYGIIGVILFILPMIIAITNVKFGKGMNTKSKMLLGLATWLFSTSFFSHNIPYTINGWIAITMILSLTHKQAGAKQHQSRPQNVANLA